MDDAVDCLSSGSRSRGKRTQACGKMGACATLFALDTFHSVGFLFVSWECVGGDDGK